MTFYLYNELATMTIKKTSAVTASVANTAKRVIVMLVSAVAFGEDLTVEKKVRPHPLARVPHPSQRRPLRARGRHPPHPLRVTPTAPAAVNHLTPSAPHLVHLVSGFVPRQIGATVAIGGVFLYSIIDDLLAPKKKDEAKKA